MVPTKALAKISEEGLINSEIQEFKYFQIAMALIVADEPNHTHKEIAPHRNWTLRMEAEKRSSSS